MDSLHLENVDYVEARSTPKKKLKQARLPFIPLPIASNNLPDGTKKRKLSNDSDYFPIVKIYRIDDKDRSIDNDVSIESKQDQNNADQTKTSPVVKKTKDSEIQCIIKDRDDDVKENIPKPKKSNDNNTINLSINSEDIVDLCDSTQDGLYDNIITQDESHNELENESKDEVKLERDGKSGDEMCVLSDSDNIVNSIDDSFEESLGFENKSSIKDGDMVEEQNHVVSSSATTPSSSKSKSGKLKKLTPKQLYRKQEFERRRRERELLKQEKLRRLAERKEELLKRKAEREEQKKQEKEEKERKRKAELDAKNEEKRIKEEERKVKEEERRAKEEEKRLKDEEKRAKEEERRTKEEQEKKSKEKLVANFTKFFVNKQKNMEQNLLSDKSEEDCVHRFMPFQIKENMKLACTTRRTLDTSQLNALDKILHTDISGNVNILYLDELKSNEYKIGRSKNTWHVAFNSDESDDAIVEDNVEEDSALPAMAEIGLCTGLLDENRKRYRCKLLQFHENRRPAYWGTWRKLSKAITGRTPFNQDKDVFDYEIDSDDEWEEEEPGESIRGSDDEKEKESEDDYEVDNDVFVPHGYLSDEEAQDELKMSPDTQKLKLKYLEEEFNAELSEKTKKLKPKVYGCIWVNNDIEKGQGDDCIINFLLSFRAVWRQNCTPFTPSPSPILPNDSIASQTSTPRGKPKQELPESAIPELVKFIHMRKKNAHSLAKEFILYLANNESPVIPAIIAVVRKIKEIAQYKHVLKHWSVSDEIINQYDLTDFLASRAHMESKLASAKNKSTVATPTAANDTQNKMNQVPTITKFMSVTPKSKIESQLTVPSPLMERPLPVISPSRKSINIIIPRIKTEIEQVDMQIKSNSVSKITQFMIPKSNIEPDSCINPLSEPDTEKPVNKTITRKEPGIINNTDMLHNKNNSVSKITQFMIPKSNIELDSGIKPLSNAEEESVKSFNISITKEEPEIVNNTDMVQNKNNSIPKITHFMNIFSKNNIGPDPTSSVNLLAEPDEKSVSLSLNANNVSIRTKKGEIEPKNVNNIFEGNKNTSVPKIKEPKSAFLQTLKPVNILIPRRKVDTQPKQC